jgi:hypothetical protein
MNSKKTPSNIAPARGGAPKTPVSVSVQLGALADAYEVLLKLADREYGGDTSAKILRLSRATRADYVRYVQERQVEAEKFGEKQEDGKVQIKPEQVQAFTEALKPLREEMVNFNPALRLDKKALAEIKISPAALELFSAFVDLDE